MSIKVGDVAPDFEWSDTDGQTHKLSGLRGKRVVLYFFPKAFTTGCTLETKKFADLSPSLRAKGVEVVGISVDDPSTQLKFAASCQASFPIAGDLDKSVSRSYGVLGLVGYSKRVTFLLDEKGVITEVVESMLPGPHTAAVEKAFLT